jgi:hypothetical protein
MNIRNPFMAPPASLKAALMHHALMQLSEWVRLFRSYVLVSLRQSTVRKTDQALPDPSSTAMVVFLCL